MSSPIIFKDRAEAGEKLALLLQDFKNTEAIVLAIPRGGVIVAKEVADELNLPLDIIVTKKIGAPENNEYAIGAIDLLGNSIINNEDREHINGTWLEKKILSEKAEAARRWSVYRQGRGPLNLNGKTVIIIDDGIATGLTMRAAVGYAKNEGARKIIVAAPVAATDSVRALKNETEVRTIETPDFFSAVGEWYENFPQISDQEVIEVLSA